MALSRKMLSAMGIEEDKIEQIIQAHAESVNALKDKIEEYEDDAKQLPKVEKELTELKDKVKEMEGKDNPIQDKLDKLQKKYDDLKAEHDNYKADVESKETRKAKEAAYKAILKDAGIPEKHYEKILKYSPVDDVELDQEGKATKADEILKSIKTEWGDHIETQSQQGTTTSTPPANNGGGNVGISRAKQLAQKFAAERYGAPVAKESNKEG